MSSERDQAAVNLADLTLDDFKTWTTVEWGQESLLQKIFLLGVIKFL